MHSFEGRQCLVAQFIDSALVEVGLEEVFYVATEPPAEIDRLSHRLARNHRAFIFRRLKDKGVFLDCSQQPLDVRTDLF